MQIEVLNKDGGCDNDNNVAQEVRGRRSDGDNVTRNEKIVTGVLGEGAVGYYI